MSNVAIEAEVVQSPQLLVRLDVRHYNVGVLLVCPLLAQELVEVYRLQCTNFCSVLDQLIQVSFLGLFTLFALLSEVNASVLPSLDTFLPLLLQPVIRHRTDLFEDFFAQARHLLHMLHHALHLLLEAGV